MNLEGNIPRERGNYSCVAYAVVINYSVHFISRLHFPKTAQMVSMKVLIFVIFNYIALEDSVL